MWKTAAAAAPERCQSEDLISEFGFVSNLLIIGEVQWKCREEMPRNVMAGHGFQCSRLLQVALRTHARFGSWGGFTH